LLAKTNTGKLIHQEKVRKIILVSTRIKLTEVIQKEELPQAIKTKVTKIETITTEVVGTGADFSKADIHRDILMSLISLCWFGRVT
jgi:hypothetical protein